MCTAPVQRGSSAYRVICVVRQVRHLAARALVPLVPPTALASTLAAALADVPAVPPIACHNQARAMLF